MHANLPLILKSRTSTVTSLHEFIKRSIMSFALLYLGRGGAGLRNVLPSG